MKTPFAKAATEAAQMCRMSTDQLRADLQKLNVALTTEGNQTVAERLAHDTLLEVLNRLAPATDMLGRLAETIIESNT